MTGFPTSLDNYFMGIALNLARRGVGNVAPNPAVGCVIASADSTPRILGRGWTQPGGRPHAETEALHRAGTAARGAVAYVTLEPCAHHGQTPPCAQALIDAGVSRVVAAMQDPDPRVAGKGFALLREAGITVQTGVCAEQAELLNAGFLSRCRHDRPVVTLKVATTLDGRIATHSGESRWITGASARARTHLLRATHDAIMVGSNTALVDDPELTCRLAGLEARSPLRVIADGRMRLPLTSKFVRGAATQPSLMFIRNDADRLRAGAYRDAGIDVVRLPAGNDGHMQPDAMLRALGERGINSVLVEGGAVLAATLIGADLVDRLVWFRAAKLIGGDGIAAIAPLGLDHLADSPVFLRESVAQFGEDLLETYRRRQYN
jgi:diaminohydroxyphosphoribosylaminopyrimidine deaminase/5-amino-6-(5-phosphoribosylamino)uracil reductase